MILVEFKVQYHNRSSISNPMVHIKSREFSFFFISKYNTHTQTYLLVGYIHVYVDIFWVRYFSMTVTRLSVSKIIQWILLCIFIAILQCVLWFLLALINSTWCTSRKIIWIYLLTLFHTFCSNRYSDFMLLSIIFSSNIYLSCIPK